MKQKNLPETGYEYLLEFFEDYDYRKPKVPKEQLDFRSSPNIVGHQQRAFLVYWSLKVTEREKILDIGCGQAVTPKGAIGIDKIHGIHPAYGGIYKPTIQASGEELPIKSNSVSAILSNHSIEHMDAKKAFNEWLRVLKPGGIIALVTPDGSYGPVPDLDGHVREYSPAEFLDEILNPLIAEGKITILEMDTFRNHFSWNLVVKKREK